MEDRNHRVSIERWVETGIPRRGVLVNVKDGIEPPAHAAANATNITQQQFELEIYLNFWKGYIRCPKNQQVKWENTNSWSEDRIFNKTL